MNKNGIIAVVVVVVSVVLVGLWAMRSGSQVPPNADCSAPPAEPTGVTYTADGNQATLRWDPAAGEEPVTTYIIEAGSTPGANNQGTFVAPASSTTFQRDAAPGTYYVRMYARNACGTSAASQELTVTIQ